jgi:four helix bundle protein
MKDFKDLLAWQKAHQLTLHLYKRTSLFPREELFGMTSQIRRCAASIGANIAEGCGRRGDGDFLRFLQISLGSLDELEYHLILARDLGFIKIEEHDSFVADLVEVRKMLSSLKSKVRQDRNALVSV